MTSGRTTGNDIAAGVQFGLASLRLDNWNAFPECSSSLRGSLKERVERICGETSAPLLELLESIYFSGLDIYPSGKQCAGHQQ